MAFAQPNQISYQCVVTQAGIPAQLNSAAITVTLYADQYAGDTLWQDVLIASTDAEGVLNLILGSRNMDQLPEMPHACWLGISIDGDSELRPLSQITSVPYALSAQKLSTPYVSEIVIDSISYNGTLQLVSDTNGCLHYKP